MDSADVCVNRYYGTSSWFVSQILDVGLLKCHFEVEVM